MGREIKFRVWHPEAKKMFYEYDLEYCGRSFVGMESPDGGDCLLSMPRAAANISYARQGRVFSYHPDQVTQQYTGLKDKGGKEIYEGDIIRYNYPKDGINKVIVRWSHENEDNHPGFRIKDLWGQYGDCEIIGNIFENPELLK